MRCRLFPLPHFAHVRTRVQSGAADVLWYTDNTSIEPSVSLAAMPTSAELLASLHTRPGRPVTRDQISGDAQVSARSLRPSAPLS